jgi:lysozyme
MQYRPYSENCVRLVKQFESLKLESYQDSGGLWTIGWGHTEGVRSGMRITQEKAEEFLQYDLEYAAKVVSLGIRWPFLNANQYDSLVSFTFNVGGEAFINSTLRKLINTGKIGWASPEFMRWVYADHVVSPGLKARREAEQRLFDTPPVKTT